jgi:hypothetical protein
VDVDEDALPRFDDAVLRALARWPDVPDCYGWLGLDRRGRWRIRGEPITHARANAFLSRHYRADARGAWFVQNGPQRAFVELEYTPWIYRFDPAAGFSTHTGVAVARLDGACSDDDGNLLLVSSLGVGVLDDRDLGALSRVIEDPATADGVPVLHWRDRPVPLARIARADVPRRFGFEPRPRPDAA